MKPELNLNKVILDTFNDILYLLWPLSWEELIITHETKKKKLFHRITTKVGQTLFVMKQYILLKSQFHKAVRN